MHNPMSMKENYLKPSYTKETHSLGDPLMDSFKTLKEEIMPTLHEISLGIEKEGELFNSFYKARITFTPKPGLNIRSVEQTKLETKE